jgi:cytochrome c biogenesis protein CcmG/thiol:disulfide interchange protein DsbE
MRWYYFLPVLAFIGLLGLFATSLMHAVVAPPGTEPSTLVDRPAPQIALPALDAKTQPFLTRDLAAGHVTVLNVWASWCVPCRAEAPALAQLARVKDIALYGLVYKDSAARARRYLNETGNPYSRIVLDRDGLAGIGWGVTGVPETFVVDGRGIVRLHYAGPLVGGALEDTVLPAIARARHEG